VVVAKSEVIETYDRALSVFGRPVDPNYETGTKQVGGR
jgi:hypothetical protein